MRTLLFLLAAPLVAQPLSVGLKAGYHPTHWYSLSSGRDAVTDLSKLYTLGPAVELRLPFGLGLEADALYRRQGLLSTGGISGSIISSITRSTSWEFPVLGKYRKGFGPLAAFVLAGPTFRRVGGATQDTTCIGSLCTPEGTRQSTQPGYVRGGVTGGIGAEFKVLGPRLTAELRLTRYGADTLRAISGSQVETGRNQALFLIGLMF